MAMSFSLFAHNLAFYSLHPAELQKALEHCPMTEPADVSCSQLNQLAIRTNQLVSELHYSPQLFGQRILALQESLAQAQMNLNDPVQIEEQQRQLHERLAIVKWLEAPRG